jgi:hypothetical protein
MFLSKGTFHSDSLSLGISLARKYLSKEQIKKNLFGDVSLWALFGGSICLRGSLVDDSLEASLSEAVFCCSAFL